MARPTYPICDHQLRIAAPMELCTAVAAASRASMQSINSYARGAILERLRKDGFSPSQKAGDVAA